MAKKQPIKKEDWDNIPIREFVPKMSNIRFYDGQIDFRFEPYQRAKEFWPNEGVYKPKMIRK